MSDIRLDELFAFELFQWLPPNPVEDHEYGLRDVTSGGWEQKIAPFLMITFREKVSASSAARDPVCIGTTVKFLDCSV